MCGDLAVKRRRGQAPCGCAARRPSPSEVPWQSTAGFSLEAAVTFRRQHAIGNYIADFCCPRARLVIELDGGQHLEQGDYDRERTEYLESLGYKVIRFWNNDVMKDMEGVIRAIMYALEDKSD